MASTHTTPTTLLRRPSVEASTGYARTTIYRRIKNELFPRPVDLGGGIVGWPASEIEAINQARIAGQSDEQIKELVAKFNEGRRELAARDNKANKAARIEKEDNRKSPVSTAKRKANGGMR